MGDAPAYGLWQLVVINSLVILVFAFSFFRPQSRRDWRALGAFAGFIVALFTEMYGFPLTIYLLAGWLGSRFPHVDLLSHNAGHLWHTLLGWKGDAHFDPLHLFSYALIIAGFWLMARAWRVLFRAQQEGRPATTGPYARLRHPQYLGFILIMVGFLVQWPTLPTLLMSPVLVWIYVRLARREERESLARFGQAYADYAARTPAFIPQLRRGDRRGNYASGHGGTEI
ncbi:MAG: isoprenylcysteine carboxylmethyltransferase family protein [Desulfarculaceae bacterium]|nr:isoprenylcysteine carboxylmethyltransferase family protein [Desulfarculaceae bacterium]MCF8047398.1 isoprenylcysteine carboxylmethyltransferase family protein [Desulfarculaceae bacterium]MCF8096660.1 isoprenylcysteine carboxylmethyltransferase family protein [Desulfarculaceae bacterium]